MVQRSATTGEAWHTKEERLSTAAKVMDDERGARTVDKYLKYLKSQDASVHSCKKRTHEDSFGDEFAAAFGS
eukprot:12841346-Ditylum_brightwellii.AAC.1